MKENEKEDKLYRNTISFVSSSNNILKNEKVENNTRRTSLSNDKLLTKYIPRLKPVETTINPSPINLISKEEILIDENFKIEPKEKWIKKFLPNKIKSFEVTEDIKDYAINSTDEDNNKKKLPKDISDSSDNESKDNKLEKTNENNKNNKPENNINKIEKIKKNVNYCFDKIRKKLDKIKNSIKMKKFKDDSNALNFSYREYFSANNRKLKSGENFINKILADRTEKTNYDEIKNKTISFREINFFKAPILGYLQKKETSNKSNLSSNNLSEI